MRISEAVISEIVSALRNGSDGERQDLASRLYNKYLSGGNLCLRYKRFIDVSQYALNDDTYYDIFGATKGLTRNIRGSRL
jgi:hypothetical protein